LVDLQLDAQNSYLFTYNTFIKRRHAGRLRVRFPMVPLELFIDIIVPAALWPWGWLSL